MSSQKKRVLILGRSAPVLRDAVALLRDLGYGANASNQFERALDDYDPRDVDLVILGGMVPAETKQSLRRDFRELNPQVSFLQGLGGIAPLLVAQVKQFFSGAADGVEYDAAIRSVRVTLAEAKPVVVEGLWAEFVPPDPVARSVVLTDGVLTPGVHEFAVPDDVPPEGSYAIIRIGENVSALRIGEMPAAIAQVTTAQSLPAPAPVSTRLPW